MLTPMRRPSRLAVSALAVVAAGAVAMWWWQGRTGDAWPERALPHGNLLLITIDTLRADRLTPAAMPRLSAFAGSAHRYRTAYAHAPLTLPSHASILTGLLPPVHGVRGNGAFRLEEERQTLAERLAAAGYRTGAFVGAFVLDSRFGLAQGFDRYESVDDDRAFAADFGFAERRAPDVLAGTSRWILDADAARPWFGWVHLFDPHAPYEAPRAAGLGPYDDEVHFVDEVLGDFLDRLARDGALASTLIVITADHGEGLGEHGESTHGLFAYDATMRVPLIVSGPGLGAGDHEAAVAHVDVVPTVLDVLGLPPDPGLPGRSLRTLSEADPGRPIYLEAHDGWLAAGAAPLTAVVSRGLKFIELPEPELYDLAEDPTETRNLFASSPERVRPLEAALRSLAAGPAPSSAAPRDPDAEARLRALGYAAGSPRARIGPFQPADDPKRLLPLYERFLELLANGGRDVDAMRALTDQRPGFEGARMAAASVLIETGRAGEAVALLEIAAAAPGASQALAERLGAAYLAAGRADRAAALLTSVVEGPHASADAWNSLGVARATLGDAARAREAFNEAVRLAPGSARFLMNHAVARLETGDRAGAMTELRELTSQHPDTVDGWKLLATLRHDTGDRAGAVEAWQRVLAIDTGDLDTLFNLAVTLRDLGRTDQAREAAGRFVARAPRPKYDREVAILAPLTRD